MSWLARLVMFAAGAAAGGAILLLLQLRLVHSWLPLSVGILYSVLAGLAPWRPRSRFLVLHCAAVISGVFGLWLGSQYGFGTFADRRLQGLAVLAVALGAALLAGSVVAVAWLPSNQRRTAALMTVACLMAWMVAYASSSAGGTDPFLAFFRERLGLGTAQADLAVKVVRKLIHFLFYGFLALTCARAALHARATRLQAVPYALAVCLVIAGFDEYRQSMAEARTGSTWDIGLDMAGAAAFLCIPFRQKGVGSK